MVVKDLLKTVDRLHQADVIHRGLRPDVVFVNSDKQVRACSVDVYLAQRTVLNTSVSRQIHCSRRRPGPICLNLSGGDCMPVCE